MTTVPQLTTKRWEIFPAIPPAASQHLTGIHPILRQILYNRGLAHPAQAQAFLDGRYLESEDPYLLPDMDKTVKRLAQAIHNQEQIVVYGDFDADGVTSSVLLVEALRGLGLGREKVRPYIPDRVDEGYGLNNEALSKIKQEYGAQLCITVDCGIRSVAEVAHANAIGLEMIITDHHSLGPELPPALAVVNPKREDSTYPDDMLAGVGIAYKVAQALASYLNHPFPLESLLDLVAIGTVADVAPLKGENRKLVKEGLRILNSLARPGVSALAHKAGVKAGSITAESIGFAFGPRINAAGRLAHAYDAAKLLASNNLLVAGQMAEQLNELNRDRQNITNRLTALAENLLAGQTEAPILIASHPEFVHGVVGLVASRIRENYYRPCIILEQGEEESVGSCRSIPQFHITEALDKVADLLIRYGGHSQAAGLTIANQNIPEFVERMTTITQQALAQEDLRPTIAIDVELDLSVVDWALYETLHLLEPTGAGNTTPIFMSKGVQVVDHRVVGKESTHLQIEVAAGGGRTLRGIAFQQGHWGSKMPRTIDLAYSLGVNEWQDRRTLQLSVVDIRPAEG